MNEVKLIGKIMKVYPLKKSVGGHEYITFTIKVPKIMRMEKDDEDDIQYTNIPITAWRDRAKRVERDLEAGDIIYLRAHISIFENKTAKGASYMNPKIVLDGFTPNYEYHLQRSNRTAEEQHHIAMSILRLQNEE